MFQLSAKDQTRRAVRNRSAFGGRGRRRPLVLEALEDRCLLSSYTFTLLADNGPDSPFTLLAAPGTVINNPGAVRFRSGLKSGGEGIFTRDTQGNLGIIAITSDLISAFPLYGGINDAGWASFGADLRAGGQAIFTGAGGPLAPIANTGPEGPFNSFLPNAATINNENTIAFGATLKSGGAGLFTGHAGEAPRILYVTGGQFAAILSAPNIQRNGNRVSFLATLSTGQGGVFLGDGLTTTTIATTGETYGAVAAAVPNDAGSVAFIANLTAGGQAIVMGDGAKLNTVVATTGGFSSFFGNVAINNEGQVVFGANLAAGGSGIFSAQDGVVDELIGTGDSLFGSTVTSFTVNPFAPRGLNDAGQLGFGAHLTDGRTVVVRADPITVRRDFFIDITSTLPHYYGLPARLDVHEVAPFYLQGQPHPPTLAAVLVHGRTIDAVTGFDIGFQDYSLQESMARAGINTFAFNFLGWGLSTRFGLDDARNASLADQQAYLIPNPLDQTYDNPDPFHFTNTSALIDQLDAVVNDVRDRVGVDKVNLFAWSRGGLVVGPYSYLHPEKVKNVALLASAYNFPAEPPDPLPQPGPSLSVQDRAHFEADWTKDVNNVDFPGQQDPAILDPLWQSLMARDPLGSTWGTNGLMRFPSSDYWGWNPQQHQASLVTVPVLVLQGQLDTTLPGGPETAVQIYNDLGSDKKVLIKVDGGSHYMPWEGSTSPTWKGPHATLQDAVVQWITSETYQGATNGTFRVHGDGSIEQEGGRTPNMAALITSALSQSRASFAGPAPASAPTIATPLDQEIPHVDRLFASLNHGEANFGLVQIRRHAPGKADMWLPDAAGSEDVLASLWRTPLLRPLAGR